VLGVAGLVTLAMRRASAAARYAVWLLGCGAVLLLPVLSAALPGWQVLPVGGGATRPVVAMSGSAPVAPLAPQPALGGAVIAAKMNKEIPSQIRPQAASPVPVAPPQADSFKTPPAAVPVTREAVPTAAPPWTVWLLPCWAVGTLLVLGRLLLGHVSLWWLRRGSEAVDRGEMFDLLERLRGELGVSRPVELLASATRVMPMTWGLWRARLLVPEQAAEWPAGQRRDVLLHELGHVKRWDCLTQLVSQLACAVYWFNPLAWLAARRMQVERERACDDLVLNNGAEPTAYAEHLLASVASVPLVRLAGAAVAMARPSTLEERVRAILDGRRNRRGLTARGGLAIALLLASVLVPAAVLRAQQAPAQDAPPARGGGPAGSPPTTRPSPATRPTTRPGGPAPRFGGRGFMGAGPAAPTLGDGPTCTLDATIYDVRIPVDQIGKLDVDALAKAAQTADEFEKALAALGTARPMYRATQSVRLGGDTITIGSEVPIVTNSQMTDKGQMINTVQYQSTGALISVAGKAAGQGGGDVDLNIQVSSAADGGAAISDKVKAPVMRRATLSHKGPFEPRKPFVVVSVDAGSADKDGKAVAYIGRVTLGEPQAPAAK
jgi:beta-lactamase regulating signal transducer with metallopeptidase domain